MSDSADHSVYAHIVGRKRHSFVKCIRCGEMLEDMFIIEGLEDKIEQGLKKSFRLKRCRLS